jgi:hypothetical protein
MPRSDPESAGTCAQHLRNSGLTDDIEDEFLSLRSHRDRIATTMLNAAAVVVLVASALPIVAVMWRSATP